MKARISDLEGLILRLMCSLPNERRQLLGPALATANVCCQRFVKLVVNILLKPINEGFMHIIRREQSLSSTDDLESLFSEEENDDNEAS